MQVSKWSALQRNPSFQKLFSLLAEEFFINDFEVCMCYQEQTNNSGGHSLCIMYYFEVLERHLDSGENITLPLTEQIDFWLMFTIWPLSIYLNTLAISTLIILFVETFFFTKNCQGKYWIILFDKILFSNLINYLKILS
jgi:hypothetical protein